MRFPNPSRALRRGGLALERALGVLILLALVARTGLVYWWHLEAGSVEGSSNSTHRAEYFSGHVFSTLDAPSFTTVLASPSSREHPEQWPTAAHQHQQRLNVLLIVADDLRPELSTYGRHMHTPHLTRLAKHGVTFDRAYAQVTVCNPSRVSFMTGRRPDSSKVWHFEDSGRSDWTSIPRVFADHGFTSVGVGKLWHMPTGPGGADTQFPHTEAVGGHKYFPDSMEFQHLLNHERRSQNATVTPLRRLFDYAPGDVPAPGQTYNARPYAPAGEFIDVQFADRALHLLRVLAKRAPRTPPPDAATLAARHAAARAAGKPQPHAVPEAPSDGNAPWFLGVGFHCPHEPWVFPREYWDLYPQDEAEVAALAAAAQTKEKIETEQLQQVDRRAEGFVKSAKHSDFSPFSAMSAARTEAQRSHWSEPGQFEDTASNGVHFLPYPTHGQQPSGVPRYAVGDVQSPFVPLFDKGGAWADQYYCRNASSMRRFGGDGGMRNRPPPEAFMGRDVGGSGSNIPEVCTLEEVKNGFKRFVRKRLPRNEGKDYAYETERPPMPHAAQQELLRGYSAAVSFMDSQVGRLLDALDDFNLRESTVVVFCADHGFSIGDLGQWGKRSLFEQDARVPFIVSDPTRPSSHGTRHRAIVELVDLLPTLAHMSGLNAIRVAGAPLAGFSLAHLLATTSGVTNSKGSSRSSKSSHSRHSNLKSSHHPSYYKYGFKEDVKGGRVGAVTQFVRCPITTKVSKLRREVIDFRRGVTNAIMHSCVRDVRGWEWYSAHELVVMGYSLRTRDWRYTAWLLWDPNTTAPVWRYPPLHEELYDHRHDDDDDDDDNYEEPTHHDSTDAAASVGGSSKGEAHLAEEGASTTQFDAFEGVSLGRSPQWARLRFVLFLALRTLVERDVDGDLQGGRHIGLRGLVQLGQELFLPPDNDHHHVGKSGVGSSSSRGIEDLQNRPRSNYWSAWRSSSKSSKSGRSNDGWSGSNSGGQGPALGSANSQSGPLPAWLASRLDHLDLFPPPVRNPKGLEPSLATTSSANDASSASGMPLKLEYTFNNTTAEMDDASWVHKKMRYEEAGFVWPQPLSAEDMQMLEWEPLLRPGDEIEVADTSLLSRVGAGVVAANMPESSSHSGHSGDSSHSSHSSLSRGSSHGSSSSSSSSSSFESLHWLPATVLAAIPRVTLRGELGAALDLKLGVGSSGSSAIKTQRGKPAPTSDTFGVDEEDLNDKLYVHVPSRAWPEGESPLKWAWRPSERLIIQVWPSRTRG